ncbi:MAG: aminoglycoside phosphotransferase family protein [Planctomycetes bacterium]|nr:aminoglycoside phosphotransferase family protein [Planctomycetota bacterium]
MALETTTETWIEQARELLRSLNLRENPAVTLRPVSGHNTSLLVPCLGVDDREFVLKWFVPPAEGRYYPAGVRLEDYPRRECAFYRFLESIDPQRMMLPVPRVILIDPRDPPQWILLEWIAGAVGPAEERLGADEILGLLHQLQQIPLELFLGRRDFPLNHWDVISYLNRVRLMYDPVLHVIGNRRWRSMQDFFGEALRWTDTRPQKVVHGDYTEQNILVDPDGRPFLIDFERIGIGNEDHDFAWLWIHSERSQEWKRGLVERYFGSRVGSERIRAEWGVRAALVYLALRRLRFARLASGDGDPNLPRNLALLDAALAGGSDLFPA